MIAERRVAPPPKAADDAGFSYLASEAHYERLAGRIGRQLRRESGFLRVTGNARPDGDLLLRCLDRLRPGGFSFLYCRPGASSGEDAGSAARILILGEVDAIPDGALLRLCELAEAPDAAAAPVVLLTTTAFAARLDGGALRRLAPMIRAEIRVEELESDETGAFVNRLLAELGEGGDDALPADTVAAIAASAAGDPAAVSRLVRSTLDFRRRTGARLSAAAGAPNEADPARKAAQVAPGAAPLGPPRPDQPRVDESALVISLADFAEELRRFGDDAAKNESDDASAAPRRLQPEAASASAPEAAHRNRRSGLGIAVIGCVSAAAAGLALALFVREPSPAPVSVVAERSPAAIAPMPPVVRAPRTTRALPAEWPPAVPAAPAPVAAMSPREIDRHEEVVAAAAAAPARIADRHEGETAVAAAAPVRVADRHEEETAVAAAAPARIADRHDEHPVAAAAAPARIADRHEAETAIAAAVPARVADRRASEAAAAPKTAFGLSKALLAQIVAAIAPTTTEAHAAAAPSAGPAASPEMPAAPAPAAAQQLSAAEIALCLRRGEELIRQDDIASARLYFERAAAAGDAVAARRLARTYDPLALRADGIRGVTADRAKAAHWYRRAVERGDTESKQRLAQLLSAERRR